MNEYDTEINAKLFNDDLDNIGWEPEVVDDSNEEANELFGYDK